MPSDYAARLEARRRWAMVRRAEGWYGRQLRNVADQVGMLVRGMAPDGEVTDMLGLREALGRYSKTLLPWARAVTARMHAEVGRRDEQAWVGLARSVGAELRREIRKAETGDMLREAMDLQVDLITSIPLVAAKRVHHLTTEATLQGTRASEIAKEILRTNQVTRSRANLIARTEVARTQSLITEVRAKHLGSPGYIWRSVGDTDVRPAVGSSHFAQLNTLERGSHRKLSGTIHRWDDPPIAGTRGERAHPGQIYNCFTGSTLVNRNVDGLRIFRGLYRGQLITLQIGDTFLEATPNHPILTRRGWISAELLKEGDKVLTMLPDPFNPIMDNLNEGNIPLQELFEAHRADREPQHLPIVNLYGDTFDNEVEIVRISKNLTVNSELTALENLTYGMVAFPHSWVDGALFFRGLSKIEQPFPTSLLHQTTALDLGRPPHPGFHGTAPATSELQTVENTSNYSQADLKLLRDGDRANTFLVQGKDLIYRRAREVTVSSRATRFFEGHVFTLETTKGYYNVTSAQVISGNCRCWAEAILDEDRLQQLLEKQS